MKNRRIVDSSSNDHSSYIEQPSIDHLLASSTKAPIAAKTKSRRLMASII